MGRVGCAGLMVVALLAGGAMGKTWLVTVGYDPNGKSANCSHTPNHCSLPGAFKAATYGDDIKLMTDVVVSEKFLHSGSEGPTGILTIYGGGHVLRQNASVEIALNFEELQFSQSVHVRDLTISGFVDKEYYPVVCLTGSSCPDQPLNKEAKRAKLAKHAGAGLVSAPSYPSSGVHHVFENVVFVNNAGTNLIESNFGSGLTLINCTMKDNQIGFFGALIDHWGTSTISKTLVTGNSYEGNAFYINNLQSDPSLFNLSEVRAWNNEYTGGNTEGFGKGYLIKADDSYLAISKSSFMHNYGWGALSGRNLTMTDSAYHATGGFVVNGGLDIGESSLSTGGLATLYISAGLAPYNRNPRSLNMTFTRRTPKTHGCKTEGDGPFPCGTAQPCQDVFNQQDLLVGYRCRPPAN